MKMVALMGGIYPLQRNLAAVYIGCPDSFAKLLEVEARAAGMSVFRADLDRIRDDLSLLEFLANEFHFPNESGFDGAVSYLADLSWFGNEGGYLIVFGGLDALLEKAEATFAKLVGILPAVVDRWRTQGIPCHFVLIGQGSVLEHSRRILRDENRKLAEAAARYPWLSDVKEVQIIEYRGAA